MKKVGVIGTGGVGKSAISSIVSVVFSFMARREGGLVAAVDGDVTEGLLSKILLGERELNTINDLLLGLLRSEEVVYEPRLAIEEARLRARGIENLRVVPASQKGLEELKRIPVRRMSERLFELEDHLDGMGVMVALVDFPPGDPALAGFTTALVNWCDGVIAVLAPSRRRIAATAYACQVLKEELGVPTVSVVLNKYDESQPFDEYGNRWEEVVRDYFRKEPFVVPADEELERIMVLDVIPLSMLPELDSARAIVKGYGRGLRKPMAVSLWEGIKGLEKRPRVLPEEVVEEAAPEPVPEEGLERRLEEFIFGPKVGEEERKGKEKEKGKGKEEPRGLRPRKPREVFGKRRGVGILSLFRREVRIIYPDGSEERVKKGELREALLLAGLSRERVDSLLEGDEVDLRGLSDEESEIWNVALVYLDLKPLAEGLP